MSKIKLSKEYTQSGFTLLENAFVTDVMPSLSHNACLVYIYSLHIANNPNLHIENDYLTTSLNLDNDELISAINELKDFSLVKVYSIEPLDYEILSSQRDMTKMKKFKPSKYTDFSTNLQSLFHERMLMPNDYLKYYELIEEFKLTPETVVMIAMYCIRLKGESINHNYILTVARSWAKDGVATLADAEKKLKDIESGADNLRQVFVALNIKTTPEMEDKQLYLKWSKSWGYSHECIMAAAKLCKKRGGTAKLDGMLDKFYRLGLFTVADIENHSNYLEKTRKLAYDVNSKLGLYYDNVDSIVSTYITDWTNKGYSDDAIITIAGYCFKHAIRTLEGMNSVIDRFYKEGLITIVAINQYIDNAIVTDKIIKDLLVKTGTLRAVRESDRQSYRVWSSIWGLPNDIIEYACSLAVGKPQAFAYVNHLLSSWKESKITTLAECKGQAEKFKYKNVSSSTSHFEGERNYSKEELDSIFGNITDLENIEI